MPCDPRWQESSWRRGGGPGRLNDIVATKILVFSAHWSQIKFAETEFGENRKMALILKSEEGRTRQAPTSRSLSPLHWESRGSKVRGGRYGTKGVGVLNSLFLTVWKQPIGQCQVARCLGLAVGPGSWVHCPWGFPGDFLPVIQKGESKPLWGGFKESAP